MSISVFTNSAAEVAAAIENPCRQDCEKRYAGCHAKCPEYLEYQAYRQTVKSTQQQGSPLIASLCSCGKAPETVLFVNG